jgi:hypothetical protein
VEPLSCLEVEGLEDRLEVLEEVVDLEVEVLEQLELKVRPLQLLEQLELQLVSN